MACKQEDSDSIQIALPDRVIALFLSSHSISTNKAYRKDLTALAGIPWANNCRRSWI